MNESPHIYNLMIKRVAGARDLSDMQEKCLQLLAYRATLPLDKAAYWQTNFAVDTLSRHDNPEIREAMYASFYTFQKPCRS